MSEEIVFRSDVTVELVRASASDADVIFAARVSTAGEQSLEDVGADAGRSQGLINYLMRERHGSPFEHNSMTFFVQAPIFVWPERLMAVKKAIRENAQARNKAANGDAAGKE